MPSQCAAVASQNATCPLGAGKDATVAVIVRGVPAAKLVEDKLRVVVEVALQKASGEVARMNDRQIKIVVRDPVLDIARHIRSRAKTHESIGL